MAHPNKVRGDKFEREAVAVLVELAPDLCVSNPMRMLGAGRKDDIGDLSVLRDVTIQVRAYNNPIDALRNSAIDASIQAVRAGNTVSVGMVPILNARKTAVRWLAVALADGWPDNASIPTAVAAEALEFSVSGSPGALVAWIRAQPTLARVGRIERSGHQALLVSSLPVWVAALRRATTDREAADLS